MKIISKFKDYYDYLVGIYGEDPKVVYDRRNPEYVVTELTTLEEGWHTFYIGGRVVSMYYDKEDSKFYHGLDEINELFDRKKIYYRYNWKTQNYLTQKDWNRLNRTDFEINRKYRSPVVVFLPSYHSKYYKDVKLSDFSLAKALPPEECYNLISNFISWMVDNPPEPDTQTNTGKITAHGFDLKTSFRPKIKK